MASDESANMDISSELLCELEHAHGGDVNCCAASPASGILASGGGDQKVRLWTIVDSKLELLHTLSGHSYAVNSVKFSTMGSLLASCSTDGTTVIWNARNGERVETLFQPSGQAIRVGAFCPHQGFFATGGDDDEVCIWDLCGNGGDPASGIQSSFGHARESPDRPDLLRTIASHDGTVQGISFSPDGAVLATTDTTGKLLIWSSQREYHHLIQSASEAHDLGVTCVEFSPFPTAVSALRTVYTLATTGNDGMLRLWHLEIGVRYRLRRVEERFAHDNNAMCVSYRYAKRANPNASLLMQRRHQMDPEGNHRPIRDWLVSSGGDKCIRVWTYLQTEVEDDIRLECIHVLDGFPRYVAACAFTRDGQHVIGCSWHVLRVWKLTGVECEGDDPQQDQMSSSIDIGEEFPRSLEDVFGKRPSSNQPIHSKVAVERFTPHSSDVTCCDVAPLPATGSDTILATASAGEKRVRLWFGRRQSSTTGGVSETATSAAERTRLWNESDVKLTECNAPVYTLRFIFVDSEQADIQNEDSCVPETGGRRLRLVTGDLDGGVTVWNPITGRVLSRHHTQSRLAIRSVQLTPDGRWLITGGDDDLIHIWDCHASNSVKSPRAVLDVHDNTVNFVEVSVDGSFLASGCSGGNIKLWDLAIMAVGARPSVLWTQKDAHDLGATCCAFYRPRESAGHRLVTGGHDAKIRAWALEGRKLIAKKVISCHGSTIMSLRTSSNGNYLGSTSGDKTARVFDLQTLTCLAVFDQHNRYVVSCCFVTSSSNEDSSSSSASASQQESEQTLNLFLTASESCISVWRLSDVASGANKLPAWRQLPIQEWTAQDSEEWISSLNLGPSVSLPPRTDGTALLALSQDALLSLNVDPKVASALLQNIQWRRHGNFNRKSDIQSSVPEEFLCPITQELMVYPVKCSDGFTYEEMAIKEWLMTRRRTSPMTNLELTDVSLEPNVELRQAIQKFLDGEGQSEPESFCGIQRSAE